MSEKYEEPQPHRVDGSNHSAFDSEVAQLLTTPKLHNERYGSNQAGGFAPPVGFAENIPEDRANAAHVNSKGNLSWNTYEGLLEEKIKSRLDPDQKRRFGKENEQLLKEAVTRLFSVRNADGSPVVKLSPADGDTVQHDAAAKSLHLTPAHDLVDSKVRVEEHNIEEKVKSEMSPAQLKELEYEQNQYEEQSRKDPYRSAKPGPTLTKYIEQVHTAVDKF